MRTGGELIWEEQVTKGVADRVYAHASKGQLTVTLGGDHSLVSQMLLDAVELGADEVVIQAMGTVSGTFKAYPEACLIWIDAHAVPVFPSSLFAGSDPAIRRISTRPSRPRAATSTDAPSPSFSALRELPQRTSPSSPGSSLASSPSVSSTSDCVISTLESARSSRITVRSLLS